MAQTEQKEASILEGSEELIKAIGDLDARLENRFRRNMEAGKVAEEKPQASNILDEIIDNLSVARRELNTITVFISNEVLPKIN